MDDLLTPNDLARELGTTDRRVREVLRKQYGKLQPPETRWCLDSEKVRFVRATLRGSAVKSQASSEARSKPELDNFEQHRRMIEPILQSIRGPLLAESFKSPLEAIGLAGMMPTMEGLGLDGLAAQAVGLAHSQGIDALGASLKAESFKSPLEAIGLAGMMPTMEGLGLDGLAAQAVGLAHSQGIDALGASLKAESFKSPLEAIGLAGMMPTMEGLGLDGLAAQAVGLAHSQGIDALGASLKAESFKSPLEAIGLASSDTSLYSSVWDAMSTVKELDVLSSFAGGFTATAGGLSIAQLGMGLLDDWSSSSEVDDRSDIDEKFEELAQHWAEELASRAPEIRHLANNADLVEYGVQFFRLSRLPRTTAGRLTLAWLTMWAFLHVLAIGLLVDREVTMDAIEVSGAIATVGAGLYSVAVNKRWSTEARAQIDQMNSQDLTD